MTNRKNLHAVLALLVAMPIFGCAAGSDPSFDEMAEESIEEEAPLGGEALAQRRMDLDRAWRDLLHFEETMESLVDRKDSRSVALLDSFLDEPPRLRIDEPEHAHSAAHGPGRRDEAAVGRNRGGAVRGGAGTMRFAFSGLPRMVD